MHKSTYDDISIIPTCRPHDWSGVDLNATIEFKSSQKIYNGLPLIVSSVWSLDHVQEMTKLGILSAHGPLSADDLLSYYKHTDLTHRTIFHVNMADQNEVLNFFAVRTNLLDKTKMKFLRMDFEGLPESFAVETVANFRRLLPDMVIIAGPCLISDHHAYDLLRAGADIVSMGHPRGSGVVAKYEHHGGMVLSELGVLQRVCLSEDDIRLADTWCRSPGDVVKCIALGADFVGVGPDLYEYSIEHILDGIRFACAATGSDNITDFRRDVRIQGLPDWY